MIVSLKKNKFLADNYCKDGKKLIIGGNRKMTRDNRKYARLDSLILIKVVFPDTTVIEGLVENIGFGGTKLRLPIWVAPHKEVELIITFQEKSFSVKAKCIWSQKVDEHNADCYSGFSFQDPDIETYRKIREMLMIISESSNMEL
jgi:hypothetical protein